MWIQTRTGVAFNFEPPWSFRIEDIAHALSNICRYTGHTSRFYSVAEHSVLIANYAIGKHRRHLYAARAALMHDAAEAYIGDISQPLKAYLGCEKLRDLEDKILKAVFQQFGASLRYIPMIKQIDRRILLNEREELLVSPTIPWDCDLIGSVGLPGVKIEGWPPELAKYRFLLKYQELWNGLYPCD